MTARPSVRFRPAPPPASGLPDQLDLTARHVRVPDGPIHRLVGHPYTAPTGRQYRIPCNHRPLTAAQGAMLTTRDVTCVGCGGGGRRG